MPIINTKEIIVLEEHRDYLPALTAEERRNLEESIRKYGIRDPLILMRGSKFLLDGHNRRDIARKLGIDKVPYEVADCDNSSEWILKNQLSRRNLTELQRDKLIAALVKSGTKKKKVDKEIVEEAAIAAKVSPQTVKRIVKQQEQIEELPVKARKEVEEAGTRRAANKIIKQHNPEPEARRIKSAIWELKNSLTNIVDQAANLDEEPPFEKDSATKRMSKCIDFNRMHALIAWLDDKEKEQDRILKGMKEKKQPVKKKKAKKK